MKWVYRIFTFAILAVALGMPFFIDNKEGKPMLALPTVSDIVPDKIQKAASNTTVYKWKDTSGGWNYGDTPPPGATEISAITVNPNTNLIQGLPKEEEPVNEGTLAVETAPETQYKAPEKEEDLLTLDRAMNILNETKEVAGMMESRNEHLRQITGDSSGK